MFSEQSASFLCPDLETSLETDPAPQAHHQQQALANRQRQIQLASLGSGGGQGGEEGLSLPEREAGRKLSENKLKYKKLKQKLAALCEQIQDQGFLKDQKDLTSPNKARLQKLALELEKSLMTQAIEYPLVESLLLQIQKIVEYKREHDILILKGARAMGTLFTIVKRYPSLHRNEALQSAAALEMSLKLLRIMLTLGVNRQHLLISNYMLVLSSLLSCALMREEKKLTVNCLYLLNLLVGGTNRIQLHPLLNANIQYILCSSLLKRLKIYLESCLVEDDPSHSELFQLSYRFYYLIICVSCGKELERPIYSSRLASDSLSKAISGYFQSGIQLLSQSICELIFQKQEGEEKYLLRQSQIPNYKINILLSIFKTLNLIFHVDIAFAQKTLDCSSLFLGALLFVFEYSKENFQESVEVRRLCSEVIIFIGNLAFENHQHQQAIRASGLLESLCNHPIEYLMEPTLRNIIIPTYCCVIFQNHGNFMKTFAENSVQPIVKYIQKELHFLNQKKSEEDHINEVGLGSGKDVHCRTLSRKTSVSSINSTYSKAESYSTQTSNTIGMIDKEIRLEQRFRPEFWERLVSDLRKVEDC